jgi:PIN domain nuclease of toxin-antitoxin system
VRFLLDTHALIWWVLDSESLGKHARKALSELGNEIFVSPATVWEIATKFRLGKLPQAGPFVNRFDESLVELGFLDLPITIDHAQRAGLLPGNHKDPFDRLLISQAQAENLVLISNEQVFDNYGIRRLW